MIDAILRIVNIYINVLTDINMVNYKYLATTWYGYENRGNHIGD